MAVTGATFAEKSRVEFDEKTEKCGTYFKVYWK